MVMVTVMVVVTMWHGRVAVMVIVAVTVTMWHGRVAVADAKTPRFKKFGRAAVDHDGHDRDRDHDHDHAMPPNLDTRPLARSKKKLLQR